MLAGLRSALSRLIALFRTSTLEQDFDREVEDHLDLLQERFIRRGMSPDDARLAARRAFGGVEQLKEQQTHTKQR